MLASAIRCASGKVAEQDPNFSGAGAAPIAADDWCSGWQPRHDLIEPLHHVDRHFAFNTVAQPLGVNGGKLLLDDLNHAIAELRLPPLHHAPAGSSDPTA